MLDGQRILAVVPARSGSKGIPNKNMRILQGVSLIGRAGDCLAQLPWLDARIISTDSAEYAEEGRRHGLEAPFLRSARYSGDTATALEVMRDALERYEAHSETEFDILLLIEPTSPLRIPADIEGATRVLLDNHCDSVICVSPADTKCHPLKMLTIEDDRIGLYQPEAQNITARQQLSQLYVRNGVCYGVTRDCLLNKQAIITENTLPYVIERRLVNVDEPIDLEWAEFLVTRQADETVTQTH